MWNKIQRIYVGSNLVRPSWKPSSSTLAYYPLTSTTTVNDQSGNNRNLTNANVTFGSYKGVNCAYFNGSSSALYATMPSNPQALTLSWWMYFVWNWRSAESYNGHFWRWWSNFWPYVSNESNKKFVCSPWWIGTYYLTSDTVWKYVTVTFNGSNTVKLYVNWVLDWTNSSASVPSWTAFAIGSNYNHNWNRWKWGVSEFIVENKVRTAQEIANYYNQTKWNYWL